MVEGSSFAAPSPLCASEGFELRVSRAMAELARAGRHLPRPSKGGHAGRAQVVAEDQGPPMAGLAKAEEQGPTPDGAIPCSLRRARRGPAPPASSGQWVSSSPGVESSSGGSFLPLFPLPHAQPWRCAERRRRAAVCGGHGGDGRIRAGPWRWWPAPASPVRHTQWPTATLDRT